jgi:hypothetical protein
VDAHDKTVRASPASPLADLTSVLDLLQHWEQQQEEGDDAIRTFNKCLPAAKTMLEAVTKQIDSRHWHISGWNVFEILGRVRLEDAHSDMLAWLFRPWEAHSLGDRFLQDFARDAIGRSLPNGRVHEVETRKRINDNGDRIDIEVRGDGWILAVENKIDFVEVQDHNQRYQTQRYSDYYDLVRKMGIAFFGVFLTLKGEAARASTHFHSMSYRRLRRILDQLDRTSGAGQMIQWFSDHIRDDLEIT